MDRASKMFDTIQNRDVVLWNTFISSLAQADRVKDSFQVFRRMQLEGVRPNKVTFASVIDVCTSLSSLADGMLVAALVLESGLGSDTVLGNAIIDLYGKCGSLENAWEAFDRMENKDVVSWTTILGAYSQHGLFSEVVGLFNKMLLEGITPSTVTFVTVLYACAECKALEVGKKIHARVMEAGLEFDELLSSAIRSLYAECGYLEEVCRVFHGRKQEQEVAAWNGMVVALSRRELFDEAVGLYRQMQLEGVPGDKFTLVSVLEACSELPLVKSIEARALSLRLEQDDTINTALLKAYSRCGSMRDARRAFERTPKKDVVAWSAMVGAHAHHGCGEAALELFQLMQLDGVMPNDVSFVSVFSACSHCGSVERAYEYFVGLEQDYGVKVTVEHWKCMMDLLGRAGRLGEAEKFLSKMEFEPDVVLWTTLLAACSVHGDFELGKHAAKRILELDEEDDAAHVVLTSLQHSSQSDILESGRG
ncbi:pentatricopeptide repeat-containing protein At1g11290, chloroplastic-like [Selaginella moellendorffii]|uniref:pentatricopeptide repeat-containing protein At1g11290, chloroplastic-like n=1 Tax=Selaginella moellendorffii TaxID=88036 RepID=UPI000D1CE1D7|nr:pentatricopeptide repeat-containing protein At1g11290, chloroplastic-like [Selaginella moellendorffii]XP_024518158.1 pentatricopeptide repeat-containing protein At1g11290, chloroplastic-like [Selaginella moellendorffii]XP_024518159.1 pentatricopeptide repeat-containing protein At1g11290, chloroplastic-like [Selaginella moellendorffii]|eukprot:XP_024518157.1 pentatricopeptide repeat-containing protein At1g11290, chloroplastic-like [Selaginella moellendorffii]